ncbi:MAG TPA: AraC family transcriptional regulator [Hungateiclostridium thermocellum]|uniref:Transcriptional regulator, AraC family n=2 Tax=Acetivibrio thermocellus TaxID=1515 RepID=A3DHI5_ACET2|nr:AraC family transcriptional regulator [Acetivibrio thermocellus]CDG36726.1 AraC family transcriptional regulator [Acetivibrio thermocellus BC1]ABN53414.1 transcriptional regulator, AraC family [Acetivibrio thermocellus ATCC 27405]ADU75865.1 transcriptional regulator, AraC family [Acetivibrio thermocellus DSM 1313]ALX09897.1 transcriptional regulator, AraC family [Acetivibrio thermocellus AD2]ANV77671.1 transcriptional regulator, AraC family [Acetivibrio thermocellus DSM 2360]
MDNSNNNILPKAWESFLSSSTFIPVIVKTIERFHDTSWHMEPNKHECFEMVYIKRGKAVFEIAGYPAEIGPNDIIIIKPNQPHKFIVKSESGCEFIVLSFKFVNRFDGQYSDVSLENFLDFVSGKETGPFITLKVSQKNDIIVLLNRILKERENPDIGSEFLNYLLVMELFVLISRALKMEWENSIKNKSPKIKELIQASVNYINNNYERDISLKDIARYVFLSTSYFTRAFKEEMGISPINYLLKIRVERAKELLKDTDNRISDIALSVGFSNQQRFNDIFKKYVKLTPLQYRKNVQVKKH